jgi:hypothetical protein
MTCPTGSTRRVHLPGLDTGELSPIKDDGKTVAVLDHVQDVTRVVPLAAGQVAPGLAELRNAAHALGRQFPELPAQAVLGVLTHSHSVVMEPSVRRTLSAQRHWRSCGWRPAPDIPGTTDRTFGSKPGESGRHQSLGSF